MILLKQAYEEATREAAMEDVELGRITANIKDRYDLIANKLNTIKSNSNQTMQKIHDKVDEAIGELHKAVTYKSNILRADRLELAR